LTITINSFILIII